MLTTENKELIDFIVTLLDAGISVDVVAKMAMDYEASNIMTASISIQIKMMETAKILRDIMEKRKHQWKQGNLLSFKQKQGEGD
jgi:hypothetical protein